jgi:hypothetical protein
MRQLLIRGFAVFALLDLGAIRSDAEYSLLVLTDLHASTLSGVVTDFADYPIPGVSVTQIECGKGEFRGVQTAVAHAYAGTVTKADGVFSLSWGLRSRVCMQFLKTGWNPMQVEVKRKRGAGGLRLKLPIGG